MHQFKRFYLIGAVLIALGIPFITITQYIEPQNIIGEFTTSSQLLVDNSIPNKSLTNYLPSILWSIYGLGVLLFGVKFSFNLLQIIFKIKRNPKLRTNNFINVLLNDLITPHTFFNYIFLNKLKYENQEIPKEVILHEQTHANQKHSIDILLIEIMQVIFWFNPLIFLTKKSIKLNHEFLADKAVLNKGVQAKSYQQILLTFSTNQKEPQLANAINYSSIKKRLTVMKTHTSKQKIWFRSIVLLPLLAITLYSFSDRIEIVKEKNQIDLLQQKDSELSSGMTHEVLNANQDGATREQMKEYEKLAKHYNSMPKNKRIIKQKDVERMEYIYRLMSDKQKKDTEPFPNIPPPPAPPATKEPQLVKLEEVAPAPPPPPLKQNATDAEKKRYYEAMKQYKLSTQKRNKVKKSENIKLLKQEKLAYKEARAAKLAIEKGDLIKVKELKLIEDKQKLKQEKLAYKEARVAKLAIEKGDLIKVKELKSIKDKQKLKQEKLAKVREIRLEEMKVLKEKKAAYNEARVKKLKTEKEELTRVREVNLKEVQKLKKEKMAYATAQKVKLSSQERIQVREIKTPKPPKSPLDHVIYMAKKNADFYLEGKAITSDEAIKTLKKNKSLNIQTLDSNSKQPRVYISKKPIVIEN